MPCASSATLKILCVVQEGKLQVEASDVGDAELGLLSGVLSVSGLQHLIGEGPRALELLQSSAALEPLIENLVDRFIDLTALLAHGRLDLLVVGIISGKRVRDSALAL